MTKHFRINQLVGLFEAFFCPSSLVLRMRVFCSPFIPNISQYIYLPNDNEASVGTMNNQVSLSCVRVGYVMLCQVRLG